MENIRIENTWESDVISKECKCSLDDTKCNPIKTECEHNVNDTRDLLESISCGSRLFTNKLYVMKYPNLIITNSTNNDANPHSRNSNLHIFDTIQNKVYIQIKIVISFYIIQQ